MPEEGSQQKDFEKNLQKALATLSAREDDIRRADLAKMVADLAPDKALVGIVPKVDILARGTMIPSEVDADEFNILKEFEEENLRSKLEALDDVSYPDNFRLFVGARISNSKAVGAIVADGELWIDEITSFDGFETFSYTPHDTETKRNPQARGRKDTDEQQGGLSKLGGIFVDMKQKKLGDKESDLVRVRRETREALESQIKRAQS